jgi:hypothetical protein
MYLCVVVLPISWGTRVGLFVYVRMYVCICVLLCCPSRGVRVLACVCVCVYVCPVYVHMYLCVLCRPFRGVRVLACVCVCVYAYVYAYKFVAHLAEYVREPVRVCVYACMCVYVDECVLGSPYKQMTEVYVCIHVCVQFCTIICLGICDHAHTCTHDTHQAFFTCMCVNFHARALHVLTYCDSLYMYVCELPCTSTTCSYLL